MVCRSVAHRVLAHPAAIDVERQLEALFEDRDAGIGDAPATGWYAWRRS